MKKSLMLLFAIGIALGVSSCVSQDEPTVTKETDPTRLEIAQNLVSTQDFQVPVVDGYTTTVTYQGMILAKTSQPITIQVPKGAALARSGEDLGIVYSEGATVTSSTNLWQTILFEDSRGQDGKYSDYDYNDVIVHANYTTSGSQLTVKVHPIALGSTKDIKLGFVWTQNGVSHDVVVAENCRKDLFDNQADMINTYSYSHHYNSTKDFTETMSSSDAPKIYWYIIVDGNTRLNSVNADEKLCLDSSNRPYGFALTTVGPNGKGSSTTLEDTPEWKSIVPDTEWTKMGTEPTTVPEGCQSMDDYQASQAKENTNYVLASGKSFNNEIKGMANTKYYVQGNMTITNINGSGSEIIVLNGGSLTINNKSIQNVTILNFGTLNIDGSTVSTGAIIKTNKNLNSPALVIENGGKLAVNGNIYADNVTFRSGNSVLFCSNDLVITSDLYSTNQSSGIINGSISCNNITLNSSPNLFVGCSINATGTISMENSAVVSVKGRMYAAKLIHMNNTASINIMSGGLIQTPGKMEINGTTGLKISVLGSEMGGLLVGGILSSDSTFDWSQTFKGNIGIVAGSVGFWSATKTWSDITKSSNMIIDTKEINVPKNSCSPGYNPNTTEDTGMAWFDYPLETENISDCYDFNAWTKGNFDMTKKSGAKVFDSNNANPADGSGLKVYELK